VEFDLEAIQAIEDGHRMLPRAVQDGELAFIVAVRLRPSFE
jgi:hypothetical protein